MAISATSVTDLKKLVSPRVLNSLSAEERHYLSDIFERFDGYPGLEQIWQLMDEQWVAFDCDPHRIDERVTAFYRHPVWVLNGLFIEQDPESLEHRRAFTDWVVRRQPARVADFGGGFGGLARFIGQALPNAAVEVVDMHPHPAAAAVAADTPNVRFVPKLTGEYDVLIATDVFEHVPDPVGLAAETAAHLRFDGLYLIANCFQPVILCHLPQLFYFNVAWDSVMRTMDLEPGEQVRYGRVYQRKGDIDLPAAREVAECSRRLYSWAKRLPKGRTIVGRSLVNWFCC
jgi:hypothetical protein